MSKQGFIQLHRKIQDHWLYQEKRKFSKFEAWIDMLMMASHKDTKFVLGNELIEIERGQFVTSELKLMERWTWGKSKLRSFLDLLEKDGMIIKKSDRKKTTITICNYSVYHDYETKNRPQSDHEQTMNRLSSDTINNDNNVNNVEEDIPYAEIVEFLNEKAGKNFRHTTRKTRELIRARWNEGFRLDDFKRVIEICSSEWKGKTFNNGQLGDNYLQPSTLFNGKFEERLNWVNSKQLTPEYEKTRDQIEHEKMLQEMGYFQ